MQTDPRILSLQDQIDTLLLVLERPVVQHQLLAFLLIVLSAWILAAIFYRLLEGTFSAPQRPIPPAAADPAGRWRRRLQRWRLATEYTFFPILGMAVGELTLLVFKLNGWPSGLIRGWLWLFWLILGYRIVLGGLHANLEPSQAREIHRRFVLPLFILLLLGSLNRSLAETISIGDLGVLSFLGADITPNKLFAAMLVLYLFLAGAWISQALLSRVILPRTSSDPGVTNTVLTVSRYTITTAGVLTAISTVGFDLTALTIIGGGLSVGIGFGLQDLVANFIAGILLMFDRTLQPGDVIEIAGHRGSVDKMRIRATLIRTSANVEVYVPNKTLLTSTVASYTHAQADAIVCLALTVGASYADDPDRVCGILNRVAHDHPDVLPVPEPNAYVTGFGDSHINFELAVWVESAGRGKAVLSDLHRAIWRAFRAEGITIPHPQRELHIRRAERLLPVAAGE